MLTSKNFTELFNFTRSGSAEYEDQEGDIQTSPPDTPRFEYLEGQPQGLKFGDGDTASLKPEWVDWVNEDEGVFVVRISSKLSDSSVFVSGDIVLDGVEGFKTYVIPYKDISHSGDMTLFPQAPDDGESRYVKYICYSPRKVEVEDAEFMSSFNEIVNDL